jgi:hypothetical protein
VLTSGRWCRKEPRFNATDPYLPVEAAQDRSFTHCRKLANTVLAPKRASLSRDAETYSSGPKCCADAERGARSLPKVSKSRRLRL